uniref:Actin-related protein 2/3 complex subunit 3 n=1 Tax=Palpitomonas bilix TaxID=652834 RepID=A0A7S3DGL1_9EUKA|mmetsp:Transcript_36788/g.95272  ORF Transcript_36788/g.95272 Transcript_36788/m.95272 type:complete len:172 (+) Transcript_36788:132-647(+)
MVYHSKFTDDQGKTVCGCLMLPLKTSVRGPAPPADPAVEDIIDEVLFTFKSNILFRNFDIQGNADRTLIYLTLYITKCLQTIEKVADPEEAKKKLQTLAWSECSAPGDSNFPLGGMFEAAKGSDADVFRAYFKQAKEELGRRLIEKCYVEGKPNKFWLCFSKRKFLNKNFA